MVTSPRMTYIGQVLHAEARQKQRLDPRRPTAPPAEAANISPVSLTVIQPSSGRTLKIAVKRLRILVPIGVELAGLSAGSRSTVSQDLILNSFFYINPLALLAS